MFTRSKLLLLIVSIVLLIALFSNPDRQHERKTPWNIQRLPDGRIHVFGLTPGKTSIQEANQILGHFAETRLYNTEPARLLATHEQLIPGEEPARLDLQYQLDELDLADLQQASSVFSPCRYIKPAIDQEIALLNTEGLSSMIQSSGVTAQFETTQSDGITLPAIVTPGSSWTQNFTLEGTQTIAGNSADSSGEVSYSCKAADIETVSVPAGVFDAVRVGCQINATISVNMAGSEVPTEWASATTIWYARDIGMVKTENELSGVGHSSVELTAYTIQ